MNIAVDPHTHSKARSKREKRVAFDQKLAKMQSVLFAINKARTIYEETKFAGHEAIQAAEDWINSGTNISKHDIEYALNMGWLKRSVTSQRLYIQLIRT